MDLPKPATQQPGPLRRFLAAFLDALADASSNTSQYEPAEDETTYCTWTNSAGDDHCGPPGDHSRSFRV